MKKWAEKFYNSDKWRTARLLYINNRILTDGGLCEICHLVPGYIVHHIKALTATNINDPEIALNPQNLMYLCKDCHDRQEGHWLDRTFHKNVKCLFDCDGEPLPPMR